MGPPDEGAGGVDEHPVQRLGEPVPVPQEELAFQRRPGPGQEAHRPVERLEVQGLGARALDGAQPPCALPVAARGAQPWQREQEGGALDVEPEAAAPGQAGEDLGHALLLPQAPEDQRRAPGPRGMGLQPVLADTLDHAGLLTELREAADQIVEGAAGHERVAAAEGGD